MSTATAIEAPGNAKGKKKLIVIVGAAVLVLAIGGVAAMMVMKKSAHADDDEAAPAVKAAATQASGAPPVFVPLDAFTVNLADRNSDRYAQVGITLEIDSNATADRIKAHMPAIRNNILLAIADRNAAELLDREGKTALAERVKRETARALGYEVDDEDDIDTEAEKPAAKPKKKRKAAAAPVLPVRAVHFSNFIIQ